MYFLNYIVYNKVLVFTVQQCGFSPVCLLMCTTSMYMALNGFSSLEHPSHWQTKDFLLVPTWSLLRCCKTKKMDDKDFPPDW